MWDGRRKRSKSTVIASKEERERETLFLLAAVISDQCVSGHSVALCIVTRTIAP